MNDQTIPLDPPVRISLIMGSAGVRIWWDRPADLVPVAFKGQPIAEYARIEPDAPLPTGPLQRALETACTDFLDANPDSLTSPEDLPNHALVTCDQMIDIVRNALLDVAESEQVE